MRRHPGAVALVVTDAAIPLLSARCGGERPGGVAPTSSLITAASRSASSGARATSGTRKGSASPAAVATTTQKGPVAFAVCIRSHGAPAFPNVAQTDAKPSLQQLGVGESQFQTAESACADLLPNGGIPGEGQTLTAADRNDYLKAVACPLARIPRVPGPTFQTNHVTFNVPSSLDKNSPRFRHALTSCRKLIPAGLPGDTPGTP